MAKMKKVGEGIPGALERNYARLESSFFILRPTEQFEDFKQEIIKMMDDGATADDLTLKYWIHYLPRNNKQFRVVPILLSIAYFIQAQRLFESGRHKKAWHSVLEGSFYVGVAFNELIDLPHLADAANRQEIARNAGNARSRRFKTAKDNVIKLLKEKCPAGGWGKPSLVVAEIEVEMREFIQKESISLSSVSLPNTLRRWLSTDNEILSVYNELKAKKSSRPV